MNDRSIAVDRPHIDVVATIRNNRNAVQGIGSHTVWHDSPRIGATKWPVTPFWPTAQMFPVAGSTATACTALHCGLGVLAAICQDVPSK
jgi:hypothetical protein